MASLGRAVSPCVCRPVRPILSLGIALPMAHASTSCREATSAKASKRSVAPTSFLTGLQREKRQAGWFSRAEIRKRSFHSSAVARTVRDPYGTLGVDKDAGASEIKKKYYKLAKQYHPDSNKDKSAKEKFVEIQEAYDILSDDKKRADFDRFGAASQQQGFDSEAYDRASSSFGGAGFGDFFGGGGGGGAQRGSSDIFDSLFGAFGGRGGQARPGQVNHVGEDIEVNISIPFEDAAKGTSRTINLTPVVDCHTCKGTGLKAGVQKQTCKTCSGSGTRTFTIQSGFQMASTCNTCGGQGTVAPEGSACASCVGVGKVRERTTVDFAVPPGVEDGMKIRIDGKGDAPIGGKGRTGDLFVRVKVQPSKIFTRQGSNLYQDISIPFYTAILGGRAKVKTLDKDVEVRVSPGTQPGEELLLRGKGVKKLFKEDYGDLYIKFAVNMPRTLTPAQRRILQQFVSETDSPGSAAYAPQAASSSSKTTKREAGRKIDESSPGFSSQSAPPSSEPATGNKWWATLGDDITEPPEADKQSDPTKASVDPSTKDATTHSSEINGAKDSRGAAAKKDGEINGEDHTVMGDLWKAGQEKVEQVKEALEDKAAEIREHLSEEDSTGPAAEDKKAKPKA